MPVYEYRCPKCGAVESVLARKVGAAKAPRCRRCRTAMTRAITAFAFHQSIQSRLDQLDPKYDKMIDASNPDLASENLVKQWGLEKPLSDEQKRKVREKLEHYPE